MRISIVAIGQRMPAWVDAACGEYAKRLPREFAVELVELKPAPRTLPTAAILAHEAARIGEACGRATIVALDERGDAWTSSEFARRLGRWRDDAQDVAFVIGSADGLDAALKARAHARLARSGMTLPHALARVVLYEQVFRAWSLLHGHPYHRA
jgi:23S rRNA (pseudouridine1915-N3)-methyltransferase